VWAQHATATHPRRPGGGPGHSLAGAATGSAPAAGPPFTHATPTLNLGPWASGAPQQQPAGVRAAGDPKAQGAGGAPALCL
jgi:hypothetical protein